MSNRFEGFTPEQQQSIPYIFFDSLEYGEHCIDWQDFETYIFENFRKAGCTMVHGLKKNDYVKEGVSIKEYIHEKESEIYDDLTVINDYGTIFKNVVVYQPFGTFMSPDFLWFTSNYIVPIECKVRNSQVPKWNSLPTEDTLIIFGSKKDKVVTFFWGYQVLMGEPRRELRNIKAKMHALWEREYKKTKKLKDSNLSIRFNFTDFSDSNNYSSHKLNAIRERRVLEIFLQDQ